MLESDAKPSRPVDSIAAPVSTVSEPSSQKSAPKSNQEFLSSGFVSMFDDGALADDDNTEVEYMCHFCKCVASEAANIQHTTWCASSAEPLVNLMDPDEKRRRELRRAFHLNPNLPVLNPHQLLEQSRWNEKLKLMCVCGGTFHMTRCVHMKGQSRSMRRRWMMERGQNDLWNDIHLKRILFYDGRHTILDTCIRNNLLMRHRIAGLWDLDSGYRNRI